MQMKVDVRNEDSNEIATVCAGSIPIIYAYLQKIDFANRIDRMVAPLRSNNRRCSHGITATILILYLFCRAHIVYKVEEWVQETPYLMVLFPGLDPTDFSEERIERTLDAIHKAGTANIMFDQSARIIDVFNVKHDTIFFDLTNFSVSGRYSGSENEEISFVDYACSPKSKDRSKKAFVLEAAVTDDGGIPLHSASLPGKTSDVTRYWPMWQELKELFGTASFLTVGDCKLSSNDNLINICKSGGFYLAPIHQMNAKEQAKLKKELDKPHELEELYKYEKTNERDVIYSGFEIEDYIYGKDEGKPVVYLQRRCIIHSSQLEEDNLRKLANNKTKGLEQIDKIKTNAANNSYKNIEAVVNAIEKVISKFGLSGHISYDVKPDFKIERKATTKGPHTEKTVYVDEKKEFITVTFSWINDEAYRELDKYCGYFILVTNKPKSELSLVDVLLTYKRENKVERVFSRLKGPLQSVPIHLHLPRRIETMMYLLMTCVQVMTLIDRSAENNLKANDEVLSGLVPRKTTAKPKSEAILELLSNISYTIENFDGTLLVEIHHITKVKLKIIEILDIDYQQFYGKQFFANQLKRYNMKDDATNERFLRLLFDYPSVSGL
jgi:transposase